MKKLYLGIFACCFTIAMNSAESKSGATPAQQAAAIKIQSGQVTAATPEHQRVITSLSKALESRGALGTQTVCSPEDSPTTAAFHGTARKAPSAKESAAFSLAASGEPVHRGSVDLDAVPDRDEDDRESIGGDSVAGGYDSEGTTFEDDKHIDPLEYLCASRLVGGFAMTKLDAWDAVRNRQEFKVSTGLTSSTTKRAKCRNTSNFVIQLIPEIGAITDPEKFDATLDSIIEKSPRLLPRNLLSRIRDAAIRLESVELSKALEAHKAALAQAAKVAKIKAELAAQEEAQAEAEAKTLEHKNNLAKRESVTTRILRGMRKQTPAQLFTQDLTEPKKADEAGVGSEVAAFATHLLRRKIADDTCKKFAGAVHERQALIKDGGELKTKPTQLK